MGLAGVTVVSISTGLLRPMAFCELMRNWYSWPSFRFLTVWRDASGLASATVILQGKQGESETFGGLDRNNKQPEGLWNNTGCTGKRR